MKPCIGQYSDATKFYGIHQTPIDTTIRPDMNTLSGGWLGLRADEGRGKPRYCPGEAHAALDPGIPEWDFPPCLFEVMVLLMGAGTPRTEASY